MDYLLKNIHLIDPQTDLDSRFDLLIEKGFIKRIAKTISSSKAEEIDAKALTAFPGMFDMHVHLREPGREDEETVESGSRAAVCGGFTGIACMPNTDPVLDESSLISSIIEKSKQNGLVDLRPVAAITKRIQGKILADMADLKKAGAVAFSDDGNHVGRTFIMRKALEYSSMLDVPLLLHEEDEELTHGGQINEGRTSTMLGLKGMPKVAESIAVSRDIKLTKEFGGRIHIMHVSTKESLEEIRKAKEAGVNITCEVTPHHLILTDDELVSYDTDLKVNPPLRTEEDLRALKKALKEGVVDAIATDHAPHAEQEKESEFELAPFGIIGMETAFPLIYTKMVKDKVIDIKNLVEKMSINPRKILGVAENMIKEGNKADLTIVDLNKKVKINTGVFNSKSKNCPFDGWDLEGSVEYVFTRGKLVVKEGKLL